MAAIPALAASAARRGFLAAAKGLVDDRNARVSNLGAAAVLAIALAFDLLQAIFVLAGTALLAVGIGVLLLAVPPILTVIAYTLILTLLKLFFGVPLLSGRQVMLKGAALFSSIIVEILPFLSGIPSVTAATLALIVASRLEDAGAKGGGAATLARYAERRTRETERRNIPQEERRWALQQAMLDAEDAEEREQLRAELQEEERMNREAAGQARKTARPRNVEMVRRAVFSPNRLRTPAVRRTQQDAAESA